MITIISGFFNGIFESGDEPSKWEIVISDQLARWSMNGINIFMIFWSTNYTKWGGKNGVLGMIYLSGIYFIMGFAEWAWNKWDQDFENWWLEKIGGKSSQWDATILSLLCLVGWLFSILVQKIIRNNQS